MELLIDTWFVLQIVTPPDLQNPRHGIVGPIYPFIAKRSWEKMVAHLLLNKQMGGVMIRSTI